MDELTEFICNGMQHRPVVRLSVVVCDERYNLSGHLTVSVEMDHLVVREIDCLAFVVPISIITMISIVDCEGLQDAV